MITLDSSAWSDQAKRLLRATGRDAADVLKQEGKLFLQDCVKLTPPYKSRRSFGESYNLQRHTGEKAVAADIRKVFADWQTLEIVQRNGNRKEPRNSKPGTRNKTILQRLTEYASRGDVAKATVLLQRLGIKDQVIIEASPGLHQSQRSTSTGRVPRRPRKFIVLKPKTIDRYIRQAQQRVGYQKSGWTAAAKALGLNLPNWITRHAGTGLWKDDTASDNPSITLGNLVTYAQAHGAREQVIQRAFERRVESLSRRLEHIIAKNFRA